MSPQQALSIGIEAVDEELKRIASSWTDSAEDRTWRLEFTEAKQVLSNMKYESVVKMLERNKGSLPTSFRQLKATTAVEELSRQFTMLCNNVLNSDDISNKAASIQSLVKEYGILVKSALDAKSTKSDGVKVLGDAVARTKALFGQRVETPKKKRNPFFGDSPRMSFEDYKNGKVK